MIRQVVRVHKVPGLFNPAKPKSPSKRVSSALKKWIAKQKKRTNPARVKGRKVAGGRAVSLKNFTGSVIRKSNGQVVIRGRGKR